MDLPGTKCTRNLLKTRLYAMFTHLCALRQSCWQYHSEKATLPAHINKVKEKQPTKQSGSSGLPADQQTTATFSPRRVSYFESAAWTSFFLLAADRAPKHDGGRKKGRYINQTIKLHSKLKKAWQRHHSATPAYMIHHSERRYNNFNITSRQSHLQNKILADDQ